MWGASAGPANGVAIDTTLHDTEQVRVRRSRRCVQPRLRATRSGGTTRISRVFVAPTIGQPTDCSPTISPGTGSAQPGPGGVRPGRAARVPAAEFATLVVQRDCWVPRGGRYDDSDRGKLPGDGQPRPSQMSRFGPVARSGDRHALFKADSGQATASRSGTRISFKSGISLRTRCDPR